MQQKRTALVTGAAKGIGRAIAAELARKGFSLAILYRSSRAQAENLVAELQANKVNCACFACDVSDFKAVEATYRAVKASFGFIDTVVNNAAVSRYKLFTDETSADFDSVIGTNLKGVFNVCNLFARDMVSQGFGRIINLSSIWGQTGAAMEVLYSASKAGIIGLTKALADELAPSGITVNAIAPGMIDTAMNARFSKAELDDFVSSVPVGRIGTPEDVAAAVAFLASEDAAYITGQVLGVNGGFVR